MKPLTFCFSIIIYLSLCKGIKINQTCDAYNESVAKFFSEKDHNSALPEMQNKTLYAIAKYGKGNNCTTTTFLKHDNTVDVVFNSTTDNKTNSYNFNETNKEIKISNITYNFKILYNNASDYFVFWGCCNITNQTASNQILIVLSENKTRTINSNDTVAEVFTDDNLTQLLHSTEICEEKNDDSSSGGTNKFNIFLIMLTVFLFRRYILM